MKQSYDGHRINDLAAFHQLRYFGERDPLYILRFVRIIMLTRSGSEV
jgi:hypothetical protein